MCGISGFVNYENLKLNEEQIKNMLSTMKRRGPDETGIKTSDFCSLLHSRLAVIDIEHGKQPMTYKKDGAEFTLVYNGELYNTEEIRAELIKNGMSFDGHSDTEVVLKSFVMWGEKCTDRFNGIYAIAIWDSFNKRLFVARDHFGVKPFFYTLTNRGFLFASEIKTLLASGLVQPVIDSGGLAELLLIAPGRTPGSGVFKGIYELKPGHRGFYSENGISLYTYWQLSDIPHPDDAGTTIEKVRNLVKDAIERQLVSDVPIGTFLSGGLDSGIISAVANSYFKARGKKLITFSLTYKDNNRHFKKSRFQPSSDDDYIGIMCDYLSCDHVDITLDTPALALSLGQAVEARDLPGMADIDSSLLLFCAQIKKYVTVALSGESADEIFGGYPWFRDKEISDRYGFPWSRNEEYRRFFLREELAEKLDERYIGQRYENACFEAPKLPGLTSEESRIKEISFLNLYWFMQTLLERKDRMSMYSGLEVRVPFCDYRIAQYLYSTPQALKDYGGFEKGLLRKAFEGYLPNEVLYRKKSPYPKTHNPDYMDAVVSLMQDVLSDPASPIHEIIDKKRIETLYYNTDARPWYGQLMTTPQTIAYFYMLNYWLYKYKVKIELG